MHYNKCLICLIIINYMIISCNEGKCNHFDCEIKGLRVSLIMNSSFLYVQFVIYIANFSILYVIT
jgi:hypothetical protein